MKTLLKTLWLALAVVAFAACNTPAPEATPPVEKPSVPEPPIVVVKAENQISFGEDTLEFKSVVFDETLDPLKTRLYVVASPVEGITTYKEMMREEGGEAVNRPLMMFISYADMNKEINVMTEISALFGVANSTGVGAEVVNFMAGMYPTISAGTFTTAYDTVTGKLSLSFDVTAKKSGTQLKANITGTYIPAPVPQTNILKFSKEVTPIQDKFYHKDAEGVTLYLCAAKVSPYMIVQAPHYARVWISTANLGKEINIEKATEGFKVTYKNLMKYEDRVVLSPGNLNQAKGTVQITDLGNNNYEVHYNIALMTNTIQANADGVFEKAANGNQYTIHGTTDVMAPILSRVMQYKAGESPTILLYLSAVKGIKTEFDMERFGDPVIICAGFEHLNGKQVNFEGNPKVSITYRGVLHNADRGARGYIRGTQIAGKGDLTLSEFFVTKGDFTLSGRYVSGNGAVEE